MDRRVLALVLALSSPALAEDDPLAAFKKAYASRDEAARLAAVEQIAAIKSSDARKVAEALAPALTKDSSHDVRKAAARGLGTNLSPAAVTILAKALNPDDDALVEVNLAIIAALGETGSDAAANALAPHLTAKVRTYRGSVLRGDAAPGYTAQVIAAIEQTRSALAIGPLVDFLEAERPRWGPERKREKREDRDPLIGRAESALASLTGENRDGVRSWQDWWRENKASLELVYVFRCEETGAFIDRSARSATTKCPHGGEVRTKCASFLRTRLARVPTEPEAKEPEERRRRKKDTP